MDELKELASLLKKRNTIDLEITHLIRRPATLGHIGEFIASMIFGIRLEDSATNKASDGRFVSGPLANKSVDVKLYRKQEAILAVNGDELPDYFLVLTGPESFSASSKGIPRPVVIDHVYLFDGPELANDISARGAKFGAAASVPKARWAAAEIFPTQTNATLLLSEGQKTSLTLFSSDSCASQLD